jgi:hypothetical protein
MAQVLAPIVQTTGTITMPYSPSDGYQNTPPQPHHAQQRGSQPRNQMFNGHSSGTGYRHHTPKPNNRHQASSTTLDLATHPTHHPLPTPQCRLPAPPIGRWSIQHTLPKTATPGNKPKAWPRPSRSRHPHLISHFLWEMLLSSPRLVAIDAAQAEQTRPPASRLVLPHRPSALPLRPRQVRRHRYKPLLLVGSC